jgi:hypothetical protein
MACAGSTRTPSPAAYCEPICSCASASPCSASARKIRVARARGRRARVQPPRLLEIDCDADAVLVHAAEIQQAVVEALGRSLAIPLDGGCLILRHTVALLVEIAEHRLRAGVILLGGAPQPRGSTRTIQRVIQVERVRQAETVLLDRQRRVRADL